MTDIVNGNKVRKIHFKLLVKYFAGLKVWHQAFYRAGMGRALTFICTFEI